MLVEILWMVFGAIFIFLVSYIVATGFTSRAKQRKVNADFADCMENIHRQNRNMQKMLLDINNRMEKLENFTHITLKTWRRNSWEHGHLRESTMFGARTGTKF